MVYKGPPPKDPSKRARRNKDPIPHTTIEFVKGKQPRLPAGIDWHPRTRAWWKVWGNSPQAELFMDVDWDYLVDTALMHHAMWSRSQWTLAAEVRQRVAQFGATPADRAKLRMFFADADVKDAKAAQDAPKPSSERFADLHVLPPPKAVGDNS